MTIDTVAVVFIAESNQHFSRITRIPEQKGKVVILKNDMSKYLLTDLDASFVVDMPNYKKIDFIVAQILNQNKCTWKELEK